MMGYGMMAGYGLISLLFSSLILVGIVVLIVWAVNRISGSSNQTSGAQSPREILQLRYARGEITREQYQQMLSDLS